MNEIVAAINNLLNTVQMVAGSFAAVLKDRNDAYRARTAELKRSNDIFQGVLRKGRGAIPITISPQEVTEART